jgi:hypothetical protein
MKLPTGKELASTVAKEVMLWDLKICRLGYPTEIGEKEIPFEEWWNPQEDYNKCRLVEEKIDELGLLQEFTLDLYTILYPDDTDYPSYPAFEIHRANAEQRCQASLLSVRRKRKPNDRKKNKSHN